MIFGGYSHHITIDGFPRIFTLKSMNVHGPLVSALEETGFAVPPKSWHSRPFFTCDLVDRWDGPQIFTKMMTF